MKTAYKPLPKRGRGRPTKEQIAERALIEVENDKIHKETIEAKEEAYLDEILAEPKLRLKTTLEPDEPTMRVIMALRKVGGTQEECAAALGVPRRTFQDFMKRYPEVRDVFDNGLEHARISLRRKQFRMADKNAPMAIFLGKNMLGQRDIHEVKNLDKGAAVEMTNDELLELAQKKIVRNKYAEYEKDKTLQ